MTRLPPKIIAREIKPDSTIAAGLFWMTQIFLGTPSVFLTINLLLSGRADGALYTVCLLLAWMAFTLAIGVARLIQGSSNITLPAVFPVEVAKEADPNMGTFRGYQFQYGAGGKVLVETSKGTVTFDSWSDFLAALQ